MVKLTSLAIHCLAFALCGMVAHGQEISSTMTGQKIQLAVHGGAGTIERSKMTPEKEQEYRTGLENALRAGREILFAVTNGDYVHLGAWFYRRDQ